MTERRRSEVPSTALGFAPAGEHFEYHPTKGWSITVPNGYRFDWASDQVVKSDNDETPWPVFVAGDVVRAVHPNEDWGVGTVVEVIPGRTPVYIVAHNRGEVVGHFHPDEIKVAR